jgi:hypothetical protein
MKFPESKTGIGTTGAVGCILLVAIIGEFISGWWLLLAIPLLMSAVGQESGR